MDVERVLRGQTVLVARRSHRCDRGLGARRPCPTAPSASRGADGTSSPGSPRCTATCCSRRLRRATSLESLNERILELNVHPRHHDHPRHARPPVAPDAARPRRQGRVARSRHLHVGSVAQRQHGERRGHGQPHGRRAESRRLRLPENPSRAHAIGVRRDGGNRGQGRHHLSGACAEQRSDSTRALAGPVSRDRSSRRLRRGAGRREAGAWSDEGPGFFGFEGASRSIARASPRSWRPRRPPASGWCRPKRSSTASSPPSPSPGSPRATTSGSCRRRSPRAGSSRSRASTTSVASGPPVSASSYFALRRTLIKSLHAGGCEVPLGRRRAAGAERPRRGITPRTVAARRGRTQPLSGPRSRARATSRSSSVPRRIGAPSRPGRSPIWSCSTATRSTNRARVAHPRRDDRRPLDRASEIARREVQGSR